MMTAITQGSPLEDNPARFTKEKLAVPESQELITRR